MIPALTPEQKTATNPLIHTLVVAGAGAGKTSVLVARYLEILQHNPTLTPAHILTLTFTKHAAGEFEKRITQTIETQMATNPHSQAQLSTWLNQLHTAQFMTIHAFCYAIIKKWGHLISLDPCVTITPHSTLHWRRIQQHWFQQNPLHPAVTEWANILPLSELQNLLTDCFVHRRHTPPFSHHTPHHLIHATRIIYEAIYQTYRLYRTENSLIDFQDAQLYAHELVQQPLIAQSLATQYPHILIDEFQDTDPLQWDILQAITQYPHAPRVRLFAVGDIKQSIYSFRGAKPHIFSEVMASMQSTPDSQVVTLTDNFRSTSPLISYYNTLFNALFNESPSSSVTYTPLQSNRAHHGGSWTLMSDADTTEATNISRLLQTLDQWDQTVILGRSKRVLEPIYTQLVTDGIPAHFQSQSNRLEQQDLIDIIHLGQLLLDPSNRTLWVYFFRSMWVNASIKTVSDWLESPQFPHSWVSQSGDWQRAWQEWESCARTRGMMDALDMALSYLDTHAWSPTRIQELDIGWQWIQEMMDPSIDIGFLFQSLLDDDTNSPPPPVQSGVRLMTIHASKGLEFYRVIVAGLGKNWIRQHHQRASLWHNDQVAIRLPGAPENPDYDQLLNQQRQNQLEEEKRLFYVACTRATDELILSSTEPPNPDGSLARGIDMAGVIALPPVIHPLHRSISQPTLPALSSPPTPSMPGITAAPPPLLQVSIHDVVNWIQSPRETRLSRRVKWDIPNQHQAQIGSAVHYWLFQKVQGRTVPNGWWDQLPKGIYDEVKMHIGHAKEWFPALQDGDDCWPEWGFQIRVGRILVGGRADLVKRVGDQWEIIDFKTGSPPAAIMETQLTGYALALQRVTNTHLPILTKQYATQTGHIHERYISLDDINSFASKISPMGDE